MAEEKVVSRGRVVLVRTLRWVLWVLLLAAVFATLEGPALLREAARGGRVPRGISAIPVALLAAFVVGYAVYRFTLVRAGRYPAGKAMTQLALMSLFLALMVRWSLEPAIPSPSDRPVALAAALGSNDPTVRALAAEVARGRARGEALAAAEALVGLLADPSLEVRRQAHASLVSLFGQDVGAGPEAQARWRELLARTR
jgi:hypothetical protein